MTSRGRAVLILVGLLVVVLAVSAVLAYTAATNGRVDQLDQRVTRLETDVSTLIE